MAYELTRTYYDCGIVAVSNYLGVPYEMAFSLAKTSGLLTSATGGMKTRSIGKLLQLLSGHEYELVKGWPGPREIGIARYQKGPRAKSGHAIVMCEGYIMDYDGRVFLPETKFGTRRLYRKHWFRRKH